MSWLGKFLGEEWREYNAWELHLAADQWTGTLIFLAVLTVGSLWFFWTSLSRIRSAWRKAILYALRVVVLALVLFVILQPQLEFKKIR
nr:hypothetical protein [Nitrospinaceae bacterium]NIR55213.1 hypothetical protein [Nitrospinaceae bacterium]NIS85640.1 hypothetical protein [Nitrospinaceae bacterium]NIT82485.1 hypothetical protein [Nitrospinaceae bacterium]NIU44690.1 hypothetical protein [Nitrospinaceae bacterium]